MFSRPRHSLKKAFYKRSKKSKGKYDSNHALKMSKKPYFNLWK